MQRALVTLLAAAVLLAVVAPASALDRNFAASAQLDYNFAPTAHEARAFNRGFDGFTMELAAKISVDLTEQLSANLKVCYGCHGFEVDMMYFDCRVADELNFRVGRFSPSFGSFNLRHDPANHALSDKPLVYDMGRMLRMRPWNQGVLPAPFPDNGVEANGTHWFGSSAQLDYAVYVVSGFKAASSNVVDIDFVESRTPQLYYVDDNGRPAGGGRAALTFKLGPSSELTFGGSAMGGTYDPENKLAYFIVGADASLRVEHSNIRVEYLARRTDMDVSDKARFKYALAATRGDFFVKDGGYVEVEQPLSPIVDLLGRFDAMRRGGNVETSSELSRNSTVVRGTLGATFLAYSKLKIKASTELWKFSDDDPLTGRQLEASFHLGVVGTY